MEGSKTFTNDARRISENDRQSMWTVHVYGASDLF